ncbi:hypothetical protein NZ698_19090 [Chryseobacterium sp. PBS4-4]|uniref:Uncharacterized protein n=1 Tax=Chryseobacterium edaphi TaxID=2976532 RepID=A0ABT2WAR9_9FLAO|nr:hypothetical protein [Chryseobacterium edaphi]MCU7619291.1 hypothetical protein [Chryseobacterium edaphi]
MINSGFDGALKELEVEIKDLPYNLEGWSKGQDLRKFDKIILEQKVVSFYKNLWTILNNGDGEKYIKLWNKADQELIEYDYELNIDQINEEEIDFINKKCLNMIADFEDYEMKIYADGRLVSFRRKNHTKQFNNKSPLDVFNWSPLIRKAKLSGGDDYSVLLYLSEGSNDFVIIRK